MSDLDLRPDCSRCAALCCVVFHFEASDQFALEKPAGVPCPHLDVANRCGIHALRVEQGFRGCVTYDCHGAGQWVSQALFQGRSWRDDPALMVPMMDAFMTVTGHRRLLALLRQAGELGLSPEDERRRHDLMLALESAAAVARLDPGLEIEARDYLRSLGSYLQG